MKTLLLCPQCKAPLPEVALCASCGTSYPSVAGIPLLLPDPEQRLLAWGHALNQFASETRSMHSSLLAQLLEETLSPRAMYRTRSIADSLPLHRDCILRLFAEAGIVPIQEAQTKNKDQTSHPDLKQVNAHSLLAYYSLIHRDYCWSPEVDEVSPALAQLLAACPAEFRWGTTLVLGAGTARLAWELALRAEQEAEFIAIDVNPLPFLVTAQLLAGQSAELWELPGHPRRSTLATKKHTLKPPSERSDRLHLLYADALDPPFPHGSFDTILTPWFIDQVPSNIAEFLPQIHRLLKPGGTWLNQGPLIYDPGHTKAVHRYCADEVIDLAKSCGFSIDAASFESTNYLASPLSTQGRLEHVLTFHARKTKSQPLASNVFPSWLKAEAAGDVPIPALSVNEQTSDSHPLIAQVAALTDNHKTITQITDQLLRSGLLAADGTEEAIVRACLKLLWRASLGASNQS